MTLPISIPLALLGRNREPPIPDEELAENNLPPQDEEPMDQTDVLDNEHDQQVESGGEEQMDQSDIDDQRQPEQVEAQAHQARGRYINGHCFVHRHDISYSFGRKL